MLVMANLALKKRVCFGAMALVMFFATSGQAAVDETACFGGIKALFESKGFNEVEVSHINELKLMADGKPLARKQLIAGFGEGAAAQVKGELVKTLRDIEYQAGNVYLPHTMMRDKSLYITPEVCSSSRSLNLEHLVDYLIVDYKATERAHGTAWLHYQAKSEAQRTKEFIEKLSDDFQTQRKRVMERALVLRPDFVAVRQELSQISIDESKIIPNTSLRSASKKIANYIAKRIAESTQSASAAVGFGSFMTHPRDTSPVAGAVLEARVRTKILELFLGEDLLPKSITESVLFENEVYLLQGKKSTYGQVSALRVLVGKDNSFEGYIQHQNHGFGRSDKEECPTPNCKKTSSNTAGIQLNWGDRFKSPSFAYFGYELYKTSNDPYETDVIAQTAADHPGHPLVTALGGAPVDRSLLLGYVIKAGIMAETVRDMPELPGIIGNVFGRNRVFLHSYYFGSTIVNDEPDSVLFKFGTAQQFMDRMEIIGEVSYRTDVGGSDPDTFKNRKGIVMGMVKLVYHFKQPDYDEEDKGKVIQTTKGPRKLQLTKLKTFMRKYKSGMPLHINTTQEKQRGNEIGMAASVRLRNWIIETIYSSTSGRASEFSDSGTPSGYHTGEINVKYAVNDKFGPILHLRGDTTSAKQVGFGFELTPLQGTKYEDDTEIKARFMYLPYSGYNAVYFGPDIDSSGSLRRAFSGEFEARHILGKGFSWLDNVGIHPTLAYKSHVYMTKAGSGLFWMSLAPGIEFGNDGVLRCDHDLIVQDGNIAKETPKRKDAKAFQGQTGPHIKMTSCEVRVLLLLDRINHFWSKSFGDESEGKGFWDNLKNGFSAFFSAPEEL